MLTLRVWNLSQLAPVSDYAYDVYVNDQRIASGSVKNHTRADGWATLVKMIVDEHIAAGFTGMASREITAKDLMGETACGFLRDRDGATCMKSSGHEGRCKFMKIVPAGRKR